MDVLQFGNLIVLINGIESAVELNAVLIACKVRLEELEKERSKNAKSNDAQISG